MTYKYNVKWVGLDQIFDPYISGTKAPLTNYTVKIGGVDTDLRDIFAPLYLGTTAPITNYRVKDADLNTFFAKKGTARYALPIDGSTFNAQSFGTVSSAMDAHVLLSINASGSYSVTSVGNGVASPAASGTWLPSGQSASDYQVQFTVTQTGQQPSGPATITNGSASYSACTSNRTVNVDAQVGQLTGLDKGGQYTIAISLKRVSTGVVAVTTIYANVQSAGSA